MDNSGHKDIGTGNCRGSSPLPAASAAPPVAGMALGWLQTGHGSSIYWVSIFLSFQPRGPNSPLLVPKAAYLTVQLLHRLCYQSFVVKSPLRVDMEGPKAPATYVEEDGLFRPH